jgi:hypothetical protein
MNKVVRWFMFGVIISLVPILLLYLLLTLDKQPAGMEKLIGNGELLVITWVLAAGAVGELIGSPAAHPLAKLIFGCLAMIVVILATFFFAAVSGAHAFGTSPAVVSKIIENSTWFFLASLIPSGICILCT